MSRFRLHQYVCAAGVLSLATCSYAASSDPSDRLLAAGPARSDVAVTEGAQKLRQLPPDVQQDPAARVMRLQQVRRQVLPRVKRLSEDRYRQVVRPDLDRQLKQLGFDDQDVTYFLTDLDRSRGRR
jgi:hypothetical protein